MRKSLIVLLAVCSSFSGISGFCLIREHAFLESGCVLEGKIAKEDFLQGVCNTLSGNSSAEKALVITTVEQNELKGYRTLEDYCRDGALGLLSWVKFDQIISRISQSEGIDKNVSLVTKIIQNGVETLETKKYKEKGSLFLLEKLPTSYEMIDITRSSWKNITDLNSAILGHALLFNHASTIEILEKDIDFIENKTTNYIFPSNVLTNLTVKLSENQRTTYYITVGNAKSNRNSQRYKIWQRVPPHGEMLVQLEGTVSNILYELEGTLIRNFGDHQDKKTITITVVESALTNIHPLTGDQLKLAHADALVEENTRVADHFWTPFYIASVIFFGTVIVAWTDVARQLFQLRRAKYIARHRGSMRGSIY